MLVGGIPVPQSRVSIIGNFDPTLDEVRLLDGKYNSIAIDGPGWIR